MIDLQPAANPLDVPSPKPSEIVRNWPDQMWQKQNAKRIEPDGRVLFCAIGILAETAGFEWGEPDRRGYKGLEIWDGFSYDDVSQFVGSRYGLSDEEIVEFYEKNDQYGKDASADWLAERGL